MTSVLRERPLSYAARPAAGATPPRRSPESSTPRVRLHLKPGQKQAGGTLNPERRIWQLRYDRVVALGLNSRIVDERASNSGCPELSEENLHADARAPSR